MKSQILNFKSQILAIAVMLLFPSNALAATLSLSPSTGNFNKGCNFSLDVLVNTNDSQNQAQETDGTDAILIYDSSRFTAKSINNGPVYPDFPGNNINEAAGKITISGLASVSSAFKGAGTLATVQFSVKDTAPDGATQITFDFEPGNPKTTDSNVVQRGTVLDILTSVVNGSYTVGTGSCITAATLPKTGQGAVYSTPSAQQVYYKTLPPAGSEQFTFTLAIVGSVLTVLGILGLALL